MYATKPRSQGVVQAGTTFPITIMTTSRRSLGAFGRAVTPYSRTRTWLGTATSSQPFSVRIATFTTTTFVAKNTTIPTTIATACAFPIQRASITSTNRPKLVSFIGTYLTLLLSFSPFKEVVGRALL